MANSRVVRVDLTPNTTGSSKLAWIRSKKSVNLNSDPLFPQMIKTQLQWNQLTGHGLRKAAWQVALEI
jgi:hypothetical protein